MSGLSRLSFPIFGAQKTPKRPCYHMGGRFLYTSGFQPEFRGTLGVRTAFSEVPPVLSKSDFVHCIGPQNTFFYATKLRNHRKLLYSVSQENAETLEDVKEPIHIHHRRTVETYGGNSPREIEL